MKLIGGRGDNQQNYSLDDMVYAGVPEPAALVLLTLGTLTLSRRRATPGAPA